MKANKYKHSTHASITVRFTTSEYAEVEQRAEDNGTNLAEELRAAWRSSKQQLDLKEALENIESRLTKNIFLVGAAVNGLSDTERQEALAEIRTLIGEL